MKTDQKSNLKVLVTGNLGYIGSQIFELAKKENLDYLGIDKDFQEGPKVFCFNLCDYEKTSKAIKNFLPDVLIHCGSHSAMIYRDNFFDPFQEDFDSLVNIIKSLKESPSCRLIYFSSSYVYSGLSKDQQVTEDSALKPGHNFGVAKSFFEQFILRNHKNSVIFRLSSVFGSGEARHPNTILSFAKECLENGDINLWGSGSRKIQYIYMKDVINYVFAGLDMEPGLYNLGSDDYVTVADAAKTIAQFFKGKVNFLKNKPEGETLPFLSNHKIKAAVPDLRFTPFAPALTEYLNTLKV